MTKIIKAVYKIVAFLVTASFLPIIGFWEEIEALCPNHCGVPADFTGNLCTLGGELLFYRCPVCGQEFTRRNTHKALSFLRLWRLIYSPSTGKGKERGGIK